MKNKKWFIVLLAISVSANIYFLFFTYHFAKFRFTEPKNRTKHHKEAWIPMVTPAYAQEYTMPYPSAHFRKINASYTDAAGALVTIPTPSKGGFIYFHDLFEMLGDHEWWAHPDGNGLYYNIAYDSSRTIHPDKLFMIFHISEGGDDPATGAYVTTKPGVPYYPTEMVCPPCCD